MPKTPTPAPTIVAGLKQALRMHPPFAGMRESDVERLVGGARLRYFAPGETIVEPGSERPGHCYVIRQGQVRSERPAPASGVAVTRDFSAGQMFPLAAHIARRAVVSTYRAVDDTFCLAFPAALFDELLAASPVFQDFCTRQLAHLLDLSRAMLQAEYVASISGGGGGGGAATPLSALLRREPLACGPDTPVSTVLRLMEDERVGAMPVVDDERRPIGIFTRQDVIGRIVLPQRSLATPIREVMSAPVVTLPTDATAGDAATEFARTGIRHMAVVAGGRLAGVVSERDLFGLSRVSARDLASVIRRAGTAEELVRCAADIRALSLALVAQGVASRQLTAMISSLNDQLTVRVLELTARDFDLSGLALCWLGMGSEGRGEQTIATDQDNGLIFVANDEAAAPDAIRERLLPFAREVNAALDRCGYPLCKGQVMAMNPRWCASLDEWQAAFAQWIDRGDPQSLLASSIFFDFRALWGEARLADLLRENVAARAKGNPRFLKQLTDNALTNRPPLRWWGELRTTEDKSGIEGIDLKLQGSVPIVDGARIYALATGTTSTNTVTRLTEAGARRGIPGAEVQAWCSAFEYIQLLRLREQHRRAAAPVPDLDGNPNLVPLSELSDLDRRILREALRQVQSLQQRLELDYPG
jgi:CBS domain-containing protein